MTRHTWSRLCVAVCALALTACASSSGRLYEAKSVERLRARDVAVELVDLRKERDGPELKVRGVSLPGMGQDLPVPLNDAHQSLLRNRAGLLVDGRGDPLALHVQVMEATYGWGTGAWSKYEQAHVRLRVTATAGGMTVSGEGESSGKRSSSEPSEDGVREIFERVLEDALLDFLSKEDGLPRSREGAEP